ncbi:MAG: lysine--tRNA ligase [Patescibacteria group bacterium]
MDRIEELRQNRKEKIEYLRKRGLAAYPQETGRTHSVKEALDNFKNLSEKEEQVTLVGRVRAMREHGKICFINFEDGKGEIQGFFAEDRLGEEAYEIFLDSFDVGDFIEVRGVLFETRRGEKTIKAADYKMLSKSLRPLPEKWHGLQSVEDRYRKRYLDLIFNKEVKEAFEKRSEIIKELRKFLEKEDFLEVETPVLQPIYGGTSARPFTTHHNALDSDLFLRIAPELYLKRLIIGGWEKVCEFARCFRNEGIDRSHNPEFTMLEFYWAYADYKDMMKLVENMLSTVVENVFGSTEIVYKDQKIDFSAPFERLEFAEAIKKETGLDIEEMNAEGLKKEAEDRGIDIEPGSKKAEIADEIFSEECQDKIIQPTFVIHHPRGFQPLAKALDADEDKLATIQGCVAGWEFINAFSELNDPLEQGKRFDEQEEMKKEGFEEAHPKDEAFLEALEHGMPPTAGFGMGVDRLAAILTNSHSLREILLFPAMKKKNNNNNDNN